MLVCYFFANIPTLASPGGSVLSQLSWQRVIFSVSYYTMTMLLRGWREKMWKLSCGKCYFNLKCSHLRTGGKAAIKSPGSSLWLFPVSLKSLSSACWALRLSEKGFSGRKTALIKWTFNKSFYGYGLINICIDSSLYFKIFHVDVRTSPPSQTNWKFK